jgi:hypothetical protein
MKPVEVKHLPDAVLDVTLPQVKDYLIVTHDEDDTVIQTILDAVVSRLESHCKRPFVYSEVTVFMDFIKNPLALPRLPFIQVIDLSIKVERGYTGYESLPLDDYEVFADEIILEQVGMILLKYKAGYAPGELPWGIRMAILAEVAYRYENRGDKALSPGLCETAEEYIREFIVTSYI